jgi:hypothetical protein
MSDFKTILTDMPLDRGAHKTPAEGACVMEKVAILWALHKGLDVTATFSDLPECTNPVIAQAAWAVNDSLNDEDRQKLTGFIPRLLRARRTDSDPRVNVRLAVFSARYVLDSVRPEVCERAIEAAEAWLADPSSETAHVAAAARDAAHAAAARDAAHAAADATDATHAAAAAAARDAAASAASAADAADATHDAHDAARTAAYAAYAAHTAAYAATDLIAFLDALLDAWEEAVTKEGEDLYVPQAWEEDALHFVSEYMGGGDR